MKKNLLVVSALAMAVLSGSAMAANNGGEIQFVGSVTDKTCDIVTDVNGATKAAIQLGSVSVSTVGTAVPFSLKLADATCDLGTNTSADFTFVSPTLGATGLANNGGTATGAWTKLTPKNATAGTDISSSHQTATVLVTALKADGAKFEAVLNGGTIAGTYMSQVSFAVAYK